MSEHSRIDTENDVTSTVSPKTNLSTCIIPKLSNTSPSARLASDGPESARGQDTYLFTMSNNTGKRKHKFNPYGPEPLLRANAEICFGKPENFKPPHSSEEKWWS